MPVSEAREKVQKAPAQLVEAEIRAFVRTSPLNRVPLCKNRFIFEAPLVQFSGGDDPIFVEFKKIIDPTHLTPREALAKTYSQSPEKVAAKVSVISWILPVARSIKTANRERKLTPSRVWSYTRFYGEKFNDALRAQVVKLLTDLGYLAVAPPLQPFFDRTDYTQKLDRYFSNWSERHIAYAAGLGTFSLSDGFITEAGIAHRCGSVVTNLVLPDSPRTVTNPFANCLFYVNRKCQACILRCPAEAITEKGHDKMKCVAYMESKRAPPW